MGWDVSADFGITPGGGGGVARRLAKRKHHMVETGSGGGANSLPAAPHIFVVLTCRFHSLAAYLFDKSLQKLHVIECKKSTISAAFKIIDENF